MPSVPEPRCVLCLKRPVDPAHRPFCSERCRLIDLGRWADGNYRVGGDAVSPDAEAGDDPTDGS